MMNRTMLVICGAALLLGPRHAPAFDRQNQEPPTLCEAESKGRRVKFSPGGLWQVSGQSQMCQAGKWIHNPEFGPQDPADAKLKSCVDPLKQEFASGLLRETKEGTFERCRDGKWLTKAP